MLTMAKTELEIDHVSVSDLQSICEIYSVEFASASGNKYTFTGSETNIDRLNRDFYNIH